MMNGRCCLASILWESSHNDVNNIQIQFLLQSIINMLQALLYIILLPILGIVLYVVYHFLIKIYIDAAKFKRMDPTLKTYITPFTGLLGLQKENIQKYGDSHRFVKDLIKQNPNQRAYFTNLGSRPFLILCEAGLIKEVSLNQKKFDKFNLYKHSDKIYEKGIFFVDDAEWNKERNIMKHSFNHDQLKKMISPMRKSIDSFSQKLKQQILAKDGAKRQFNVIHDTEEMIGEILVRIFLSEQAVGKYVKGKPLSIFLADLTTLIFDRSRTGVSVLMSLFFGEYVRKINFSKKDKQIENDVIEVVSIIRQIVKNRLALEDDPTKDFIFHYIQEKRNADKLIAEAERQGLPHKYRSISEEEIVHQLASFYFAGIDTTGHLVAFSLYSLAEYPHCRQKMIQEIKANITDFNNITYQNLQKLEYMGYFMDQCLRKWPPAVGILARVAREDIKIGPYNIPKNTIVGTNIIGLMHNEKYFENPDEFNPDRWSKKGPHSTEPYSYIPFSAGPKSCIGKYLALMETKLILIKFLNEFDIERTDVPLRTQNKFLYEPIEENLVAFKIGGMQIQ